MCSPGHSGGLCDWKASWPLGSATSLAGVGVLQSYSPTVLLLDCDEPDVDEFGGKKTIKIR